MGSFVLTGLIFLGFTGQARLGFTPFLLGSIEFWGSVIIHRAADFLGARWARGREKTG